MTFIFLTLLVILANTLVVNGECQCGIFLMDESGNSATNEVYLSTTHPQACDRLELDQLCRDFCYQKFVNLTANGDLQSISPVFNMSSGEMFCENLRQDVDHRDVGGYYRWCQASWKFIGIKAKDSLCCTNCSFVRCEDEERLLSTSTDSLQELVATEAYQSEANQTEVAPGIISDKSEDSTNETSPGDSIRKKRNLIKIIQGPRKLSGKSNGAGPKMLNKLTPSRSRRSPSEKVPDSYLAALNDNTVEEADTNATEEATGNDATTEENQSWSLQINSTNWIPVQYLPNGMVEEVKETRSKREMTSGQIPSIVHLASEILMEGNGSAENVDEKMSTVTPDQQEEVTPTLPISSQTSLDFGDWIIQLNETSTEVTEFVKFNEEKNSTQA